MKNWINKYQQGNKLVNIDGKYVDINSPEYKKLYNKGIGAKDKQGNWITSKSNLPEVTVTAPKKEGFWKQYANKITKESSDNLLSAVLSPITAIINLPQAAATYATTGKVQNPSEALNIKNPIGQLATDLTLDPLNLLGVGIASKIGKTTEVLNSSKLSNKIADIASKSPSRINNLISEVSTIPNRVTYNAEKASNELEAGNKFLENWFNHPETFKRIGDLKEADIDKDSWTHLQRNINKEKYLTNFETTKNNLYNIIRGNDPVFGVGVRGTSGYDLDKFQPSNYRQNLVNKYSKGITSTAVHEGAHGATNGISGMSDSFQDLMNGMINQDKIKTDYDKYLAEPDEVYARLMEIRHLAGLKPGEVVTKERLKQGLLNNPNTTNSISDSFFNLIKDNKTLIKVLNTAPAAGFGLYATKND